MATDNRPGTGPDQDDDDTLLDEDPDTGTDREEDLDEEGSEASDAEVEARARKLGWRPESEWTDPKAKRPKKFLSAREWLAQTEESVPILRERLRTLGQDLDASRGEIGGLKEQVNDLTSLTTTLHERVKSAGKQGYEKAKREILDKRSEAVKNADEEAFKEADDELQELERQQIEAGGKKLDGEDDETRRGGEDGEDRGGKDRDRGAKPQVEAYTREWMGKNQHWYASSPSRKSWAQSREAEIRNENPEFTTQQVLDEITSEAKDTWPGLFENRRRSGAPSVSPSNGDRQPARKKMSFDQLAPEEKATFERLKRQFKTRNVDYTKEQYVEDYQLG